MAAPLDRPATCWRFSRADRLADLVVRNRRLAERWRRERPRVEAAGDLDEIGRRLKVLDRRGRRLSAALRRECEGPPTVAPRPARRKAPAPRAKAPARKPWRELVRLVDWRGVPIAAKGRRGPAP